MKRYLLFTLIFSNLSFSQDLTLEGLRDRWEDILKAEDNLKTLVCSGTRTLTILINDKAMPDDDNKESFTEYVYIGSENVFIRQNGELTILGTFLDDAWESFLTTSTFRMSDASINYSRDLDENFYKENPEVEESMGDLEKTKWSEELSIDRYTGKYTHSYEQAWKSEENSTVARRLDRLEGMCKLAGKQQF